MKSSRTQDKLDLIRSMKCSRGHEEYAVEREIVQIYIQKYGRDRKLRKYLVHRKPGEESHG